MWRLRSLPGGPASCPGCGYSHMLRAVIALRRIADRTLRGGACVPQWGLQRTAPAPIAKHWQAQPDGVRLYDHCRLELLWRAECRRVSVRRESHHAVPVPAVILLCVDAVANLGIVWLIADSRCPHGGPESDHAAGTVQHDLRGHAGLLRTRTGRRLNGWNSLDDHDPAPRHGTGFSFVRPVRRRTKRHTMWGSAARRGIEGRDWATTTPAPWRPFSIATCR